MHILHSGFSARCQIPFLAVCESFYDKSIFLFPFATLAGKETSVVGAAAKGLMCTVLV